MKLDWISLENFRQYFGRQRLTFSKDEQRCVTVIHGVNGAGKTSLFLAINWCLYGKSVENVTVIDNVGELVSKEAVARTAVGGKVRAAVDLSFLHDGSRYLLRRSAEVIKQPDGSAAASGPDELTMMRTLADGQSIVVKNPIGTMNAILPANVREYFLFDGEKIDNFAKPEASAQVKQAIDLVLKLELMHRARYHLEQAARDYRAELKQTTGKELRKLLEQDEKAREQKDRLENRIAELNKEIASARAKIVEIDQKLGATQNAQLLQQQRQRVERDLELRRSELETTVSQIRDLAVGAHFVVAQPAIERALRTLDEKRERGEIPSSIRHQFVQDLLEQMRCICGRSLELGTPEYEKLRTLMVSSLPSALEDDVLNTGLTLRGFATRATQQLENLRQAMQQRSGLVDLINDLESELDDVRRQLKGSPMEEISRLETQRQRFHDDIQENTLEIGSCNNQITNLCVTINQLETAIDKAKKAETREQFLGRKLQIAQQASDAIGAVYNAYADDMRTKIEAKTKEIFKSLVWKESHFQDIRLSADFNLDVIDRYGLSARPELSAGERQVLSLSFITAMSRVSEEEAPLVIDTPFGRLSSQHRESITQHLPELTKQLVLFVTDEELRDQARENLNARIGAEYRLEFNRATSCTDIVEVKQ